MFLFSPPAAGLGVGDEDPLPVKRITIVEHLGREHFRIRTRTATYLYDPRAGAFSSIIDKVGNDWVSYGDNPEPAYPAAAADAYRGAPKLVFGGEEDETGTPGFAECESRITRRNQITTVSLSGDWEWRWTFYRNYAKLEMISTPPDSSYWFLYQGVPGGTYRPRSTWWATDLDEPGYGVPDRLSGQVHRGQHRYFVLGQDKVNYAFWMLQRTPDVEPDHLSYLGNEELGARDSPDGMVVAGFGRSEGGRPRLRGPNVFLIGLTTHLAGDPLAITRTRRKIGKYARRRR